MIIRPLLFYQTAEHSACVTLIIHLQSSILIPYSSGTESMPTARWCPIKWHKAAGLQDKGTFTHYIENLQACLCYYRTSNFLCWQPRQASSCVSAHLNLIPLLWQRPLFFFSPFHLPSQIRVLGGCFLFPPSVPLESDQQKAKEKYPSYFKRNRVAFIPTLRIQQSQLWSDFFLFLFFLWS